MDKLSGLEGKKLYNPARFHCFDVQTAQKYTVYAGFAHNDAILVQFSLSKSSPFS